MNDLKDILKDAARYRWVKENFAVVDWSSFYDCDDDDGLDKFIDGEMN